MTFTLAETLRPYDHGHRDLLLAYPTTNRADLARLSALEGEGRPIVMVDSVLSTSTSSRTQTRPRPPPSACASSSTRPFHVGGGRVKIGPKRSPIRTPEAAAALARLIVERPGFELAA